MGTHEGTWGEDLEESDESGSEKNQDCPCSEENEDKYEVGSEKDQEVPCSKDNEESDEGGECHEGNERGQGDEGEKVRDRVCRLTWRMRCSIVTIELGVEPGST